MHRDQKIGLALGVLLIGAIGAFFFRNEVRPPEAGLPEITGLASLDERIDEQLHRPYLADRVPNVSNLSSGRIEPGFGLNDASNPGVGSQSLALRSTEARVVSQSSTNANTRDPFAAGPQQPADSFGEITPQLGQRGASFSDEPIPELSPIPVPVDPAMSGVPNPASPAPTTTVNNTPAIRMHTVQKGDTLSSISARYLGRESRYLEIFEANRDQLEDANGLKLGMQLKIPVTTEAQNTAPPRTEGPRKFVPFSRRPTTSNDLPPNSTSRDTNRRLSQLPPDQFNTSPLR